MSLCSWKVSCSEAALSLLIQLPTQTRERSNYSALPSMKFLTADNLHELSDYLTVPLRLALALSFLFPVADRLGMLGPPGTPEVVWGNFTNFLAYNAQVNSFLPVAIRPTLGVTATVFEILFGVTLFLGVYTRLFAAGAGILLLLFGSAMAISFRDQVAVRLFDVLSHGWCSAPGGLRAQVLDDPARLRESVRQLLSLDFDTLLVGDGECVLHGAQERLQELVETFPG